MTRLVIFATISLAILLLSSISAFATEDASFQIAMYVKNDADATSTIVFKGVEANDVRYTITFYEKRGSDYFYLLNTVAESLIAGETYAATVSDFSGLPESFEGVALISAIDVIYGFSATPVKGEAPLTVKYNAAYRPFEDTLEPEPESFYGYDWDFGDGDGVDNVSPFTHVYANPGDYLAKLNVWEDPMGSVIYATVSTTIIVSEPLPTPQIEKRDVVLIRGIDSEGNCDGANQWVPSFLASDTGRGLFDTVEVERIFNFNYDGGGAYTCPTSQPAYDRWDTCDGVAKAASELKQLIDDQAANPVTIAAHSMGGLVTAYLVSTEGFWAQEHIASVITFDSPVRGVPENEIWIKDYFDNESACDRTPDPITRQSSLTDLIENSDVVLSSPIAASLVPFYHIDSTAGDKLGHQYVPRERTFLNNGRSFHYFETCGGPFAQEPPNCEPPLPVNDNHGEVWSRQSDGEVDKGLLVGCTLIGATDCTFVVIPATQAQTSQFISEHVTSQAQIEIPTGATRIRFVSHIQNAERMTLYSPDNTTYGPDGAGPIAAYALTDLSEVYDIINVVPGTWTVEFSRPSVSTEPLTLGVFVLEQDPPITNSLPIAVIDGPYKATVNDTIVVNGIESVDYDGVIVLYEWDFNNDGLYDLESSRPAATHRYTDAYIGELVLRVTDDDGGTHTTKTSVTVQRWVYLPIVN